MSRKVEEWKGKHDDTAVPPRVRLRIYERHGGICHLSKRKIRAGEPWDLDHIVSLINGGEHRERNLAPALTLPHREKTKEDVALKSKTYHKKAKHLGISLKKKRPFPGSKASGWKKTIDGRVVKR